MSVCVCGNKISHSADFSGPFFRFYIFIFVLLFYPFCSYFFTYFFLAPFYQILGSSHTLFVPRNFFLGQTDRFPYISLPLLRNRIASEVFLHPNKQNMRNEIFSQSHITGSDDECVRAFLSCVCVLCAIHVSSCQK